MAFYSKRWNRDPSLRLRRRWIGTFWRVPRFQTAVQSTRFSNLVTWTINKPAGVVAGDLLVAFFDTNATQTVSLAGWTSGPGSSSGQATRVATLYRVADGSEGASFGFVWTSNKTGVGIVIRISGADQTTPVEPDFAEAPIINSGTGGDLAVPTFKQRYKDALLVNACDTGSSIASVTFSSSGFTNIVDINDTNSEQMEIYTKDSKSPGTVPSTAWAVAGGTPSRVALMIAINAPITRRSLPHIGFNSSRALIRR